VTGAWLALLIACAPRLPDAAVAGLGQELCAVGHPKAICGQGRAVGQSHGPLSLTRSKERWVDVAVPYSLGEATHTLTVRVHITKVQPCRIRTRVLSDDGPAPVLLANPLAGKVAGGAICRELGG
jgi:hypothetical protein